MSEKCKECKVICVECQNHRKDDKCTAYPIKKMNCVNNTTEHDNDLCINHNENGNCLKFKRDEEKTIEQNALHALELLKRTRDFHCYYGLDLLSDHAWQVITGLKGLDMKKICYSSRDERIKKGCESKDYCR